MSDPNTSPTQSADDPTENVLADAAAGRAPEDRLDGPPALAEYDPLPEERPDEIVEPEPDAAVGDDPEAPDPAVDPSPS